MKWKTPDAFFDWFVDQVRRFGLEQLTRRYYGTYLGLVESAEDPDGRGRVMLCIPALAQTTAPEEVWARPVGFPGSAMGHGHFFPPVKGDQVWVCFEGGDPDKPLYMGGFIANDQRPDEFDSELKRGIKTPLGHFIRFSDDPDDPHITISMATDGDGNAGGYVSMDKDGSVLISNVNGSHLYLNAKDNQTTLMHETGAMVSMSDNGGVCLISADGSIVDCSDQVQVLTPGDVVLNSSGAITLAAGSVTLGSGALPAEGVVLDAFVKQVFNAHQHVGNMGAPTPLIPAPPVIHRRPTQRTSRKFMR
jgi:hypothetical protein